METGEVVEAEELSKKYVDMQSIAPISNWLVRRKGQERHKTGIDRDQFAKIDASVSTATIEKVARIL